MNLQLLHAPGIGIENLELDARRMVDQFAPRRHTPKHREDQTADRIDIRLLGIGDELQPRCFSSSSIGVRAAAMMPSFGSDDDIRFLVVIVLVFDVADDLLDKVFDRHDAVRSAILIDDERHVNARRLHADQQVDGGHRGRHVENLAADFHRRNRPAEIEVLQIEALRRRRLGCAVRNSRSAAAGRSLPTSASGTGP